MQTIRLDFGRGVTKQCVYDPVEYRTLIAGLEDLLLHVRRFHAHEPQHQIDLTPVMNFMLLYTKHKNLSS
jgi:hypothetical protein